MVTVTRQGSGLARNVTADYTVCCNSWSRKITPMPSSPRQHDLGQPVPDWSPATVPDKTFLSGHYCRLEPLTRAHGKDLLDAFRADDDGVIWDYLPYGPFDNLPAFEAFLEDSCLAADPFFYAIIDTGSGRPVGMASYLRITPAHGVIEVGHINFAPALQRTPAATEAMYLMMRQVFDMWGYRRYEWKCNDLNTRSKQAAHRLGFSFEGVFRQAAVVRGRNRDTAWFSVLDSEWPAVKSGFERWLDPANFNEAGGQRQGLMQLRDSGTAG